MIYLDNAATTKISPEVLETMMPYITEEYGNAGSMHSLGRRAADAITDARQKVADLINCSPEQIIFTSGGSEANSFVFAGLADYLSENNKKHIITTSVEHNSVLQAVNNMCIKHEFDISYLGVDSSCVVNSRELSKTITTQTGLVSVIHTNNETGAVNPVYKLSQICRAKNILFHTDCVQALSSERINAEHFDFLSISSHKINAPKGVGALYAKDLSLLSPIIYGGMVQENGYRGGTENVPGIVGFGKACEILQRDLEANKNRALELKTRFEEVLMYELYQVGLADLISINSLNKTSKILNIHIRDIDGQTLLLFLDAHGVCISAGSACQSHETKPSHVLLSMGLSEDEARNSVRISFSHTQNIYEVMQAAKIMSSCITYLKKTRGGLDY